MYEGIQSHTLSGWNKPNKNISFVFLASVYVHVYVCIQFESTSQQAIMPLSDMADLHVSEFPRGRGSLANSNVEQPAPDKS